MLAKTKCQRRAAERSEAETALGACPRIRWPTRAEIDSPWVMSKTFRAWDLDRAWLLPASVHQLVPSGHLAHFVRDTVREALDHSMITGVHTAARGQPPCHPGMLTALPLCGCSRGIYSSRQLARACEERVDVMAVTGMNRPDFRTISDFRRRPTWSSSAMSRWMAPNCEPARARPAARPRRSAPPGGRSWPAPPQLWTRWPKSTG